MAVPSPTYLLQNIYDELEGTPSGSSSGCAIDIKCSIDFPLEALINAARGRCWRLAPVSGPKMHFHVLNLKLHFKVLMY